MKDTLAVEDKNIPREVKASGARWEMIAVWHTLHWGYFFMVTAVKSKPAYTEIHRF